MEKIRIIIADDHALVRQGMRNLLDQEPDLEVVAEANDGEEAVEMTAQFKPDVAIVDIAMPRLDGIEATKQIKELYPETKVLILSAYDEDQFIFRLLEVGASGYLLKNVQSRELIAAIRTVQEGDSVLHPQIARKVVTRFAPNYGKGNRHEAAGVLSEREMEILKHMTTGSSNKEIAEILGLSKRTVQGHMAQIFNKLGVRSRTEAVIRSLKEGWVSLDDIPSVSPK